MKQSSTSENMDETFLPGLEALEGTLHAALLSDLPERLITSVPLI